MALFQIKHKSQDLTKVNSDSLKLKVQSGKKNERNSQTGIALKHFIQSLVITPQQQPARRLTDVDNQLLTGLV